MNSLIWNVLLGATLPLGTNRNPTADTNTRNGFFGCYKGSCWSHCTALGIGDTNEILIVTKTENAVDHVLQSNLDHGFDNVLICQSN